MMDGERFARVKEMFDRAVSLHGPARDAFLHTLESDDLRREVQRMLQQQTAGAGLTDVRRQVRRTVWEPADGSESAASPGDTLTHYRLERRLGVGGMGEVWLAEDLALGRPAAIKLLRPGLDARFRARLLREAWASARLQHPAIAAFYESGETDSGAAYLAMEYVAGETLRDRLKRGPLPADTVFDVAAALLEGLIHAHEAGVLHRDIKPENIMLTGERTAKLLDFGLAREFSDTDAVEHEAADAPTATHLTALTAHGAVAGTLGYMSPEQMRGEPVDARTDIFAIGAVIHEMLTGRAAFPGRGIRERMAAVLSRDPDPVTGPGIPAETGSILLRAMTRDREARYPSAVELLRDLRRVGEGETLGVLPDTLAVLDLRNLSGNPDQDWIGTGVAESLATDLARVSGLAVVPRDRVARAVAAKRKDGETDPREVGLALGCRWVLDGTVQKMGETIRITTALREVATGDVTSTEKIDGRLDELFTLQDRLSDAITGSLRLEGASHDTAFDLDVFEEYSRGRREWMTFEMGAMDRGRERMERAIAADPRFAPALSGLAGYHAMQFNARSDRDALDRAAAYAKRALAERPGDAEARVWLGYALWRNGRPKEAMREFREAQSLDPRGFMAPYFVGCLFLDEEARPERAIEPFQRSVRLNRGFNWSFVNLGLTHLYCGHREEALWTLREAYEAEKAGAPTHHGGPALADALRVFGDLDEADRIVREAIAALEAKDHMLRDQARAQALCSLARIALARGADDAARAAAHQIRLHVEARPHVISAGHMRVQSLAILGATGDGDAYEDAGSLFDAREGYDFSWGGALSDGTTRIDLGRAALALGRTDEARAWLEAAAPARHEARAMLEGMAVARGDDPPVD